MEDVEKTLRGYEQYAKMVHSGELQKGDRIILIYPRPDRKELTIPLGYRVVDEDEIEGLGRRANAKIILKNLDWYFDRKEH